MKKILLIDNDKDVLDVMQEALIYEGFEVKSIEETRDIFTEIESYRPNVVIVDYLLNGINGGEICHQIKKNEKTSRLPVVLISGYPKVLHSLRDYGCDEFIAKPFDLEDLTTRIRRLLDSKMNSFLHTE